MLHDAGSFGVDDHVQEAGGTRRAAAHFGFNNQHKVLGGHSANSRVAGDPLWDLDLEFEVLDLARLDSADFPR